MSTMTTEGVTLSIRILPEILKSLNLEILTLNDGREIQFQDRILSKESVVNAVLLDFLSLPMDERHAILKNATRNLELLLIDRNQAKSKEDVARFSAPGIAESKRRKPAAKAKKTSA